MATVIGVDLGGTKIDITRFLVETWEQQNHDTLPTHAELAFDTVYARLLDGIRSAIAEDTVAVGIGVPGLVRVKDGTIVTLPNIPGSEDVQLAKRLQIDLSLPVQMDNDANCFVLAEALHGAGKGADIVVGITLGTGVGGGIVINGRLFRGAHGYAGEIGHMLLRPGEPPYATDDARGDAEQFLSGTAMGRRCDAAGRPEDYLEGEVCSFMRPEIFREVAWLCTNLAHLLDPSVIILGGSAGKALKPHLPAIRTELEQWMLPGTPLPELTIGTLPHPATLGASLLTQEIRTKK